MMKLPNDKRCCGCSACYSACNFGAISIVCNEDGFYRPLIDRDKCTGCGNCIKACPVLPNRKASTPLSVYAAQSNSSEVRTSSSSGGIFTTLANCVLSAGGYVSGAGWSDELTVVHKIINNSRDLDDLKRSKYVQSKIGDTFKNIKNLLTKNARVLFVGCPCQVAGLLQYLGKQNENLFTIDLICHGVNSSLAWRKYLASREKEFLGKAISANFRSKDAGWTPHHLMTIKFSNGKQYQKSGDSDTFFRAFLTDRMAQECCYHCQFRNQTSGSDLTIGDFWGVEYVVPKFNDGLGTSALLTNTTKGLSLLNDVSDKIILVPSSLSDVIKGNFVIEKSCRKPSTRNRFMKALRLHDFDTAFLLSQKPTLLDAAMPIINQLLHVAWWTKRLIVNHELNKF